MGYKGVGAQGVLGNIYTGVPFGKSMAEAAVVRLQKVKGLTTPKKTYYRHQITVPADIIEALGWEPGDLIGVSTKGDRVILRKRVLSPP